MCCRLFAGVCQAEFKNNPDENKSVCDVLSDHYMQMFHVMDEHHTR